MNSQNFQWLLCVCLGRGGGVEVSEPTENFVGKQDEGQKFVVHY